MSNWFNIAIKQLQEESLRNYYGDGYVDGYLEGQRALKQMQIKDSIKDWEFKMGCKLSDPGLNGFYINGEWVDKKELDDLLFNLELHEGGL